MAQDSNTEVGLGKMCRENCFQKISPLLIWLCIIDVGGNPGAMLSFRLFCVCPLLWPIPPGPMDMLVDGG